MQADVERRRLERNIEDDRIELRRALRALGISFLLGLDLPKRIRRRPLPWALGAAGLATVWLVRRQLRSRPQPKRPWWSRDGAQA